MPFLRFFGGLALSMSLAANVASAGDPPWYCPPSPTPSGQPGQPMPGQPTQPGQQPTQPGQQPDAGQSADSSFAQAPSSGTGAEASGNPNIMGDFLRGGGNPQINQSSIKFFGSSSQSTSRVLLPAGGGPLKIAENENVRPQDRVFLNYNGYTNILPNVNNPAGLTQMDYQYQTIGFESSFLDGNASFGLRVPYFELTGKAFAELSRFGDMSLVTKFVLASDGPGGDVLSAGLVLTLPTGLEPFTLDHHKIHSVVWQPWVGLMTKLSEDFYFQGFTELALPSTRHDATILFLDGAVGYWAYRGDPGSLVTGIVPTSEVHINWPWTNRGSHNTTHAINVNSSVDITEGVHILMGRASLQLGVAFNVSGPSQFDVEAIAQLNFPF